MSAYESRAGLEVDPVFCRFIEEELAPATGRRAADIWAWLDALNAQFGDEISAALAKRAALQRKIDNWFEANGANYDPEAYKSFLYEIGYIVAEGEEFQVETENVDDEIRLIAGPQLVVPVANARFALNAANARWVSLYDALYGSNALGELPSVKGFDEKRAAQVRDFVRAHLDQVAPLSKGAWKDVKNICVDQGTLKLEGAEGLLNHEQFSGFRGDADAPKEIMLSANDMRIRLVIDADAPVALNDPADIGDVVVEAAISVIMDCEDSVAAVDGEDKADVYRNWLGLMRGDLAEEFSKAGKKMKRELNNDIGFTAPNGQFMPIKTRALMLVRNVGHLMTTPAVRKDGVEISEGLLDALITVLAACVNQDRVNAMANSQKGSIYVVKPKLHGPEETALACAIFERVEALLGLTRNTVKIGVMDEERRTSVNLREVIRAARARVAFINTGFLDRTGDEIHTHMKLGAMMPKGEMKTSAWLSAYEDRNVRLGLGSGLKNRAQIGKGMWAKPDDMQGLLDEKIAHPQSGANTAWVPSPTAAAIHALHYHRFDVSARQFEIMAEAKDDRLDDLLTPPVLLGRNLSEAEIQNELENNLQGILGYVVRWVDQGIGCSKVPDIHGIGLMEDRATCRISAQMVANWLEHGLVSAEEVEASLRKMAVFVDAQNADDPSYKAMSPNFDGVAIEAARSLVFNGAKAPSGYTEPDLHQARLAAKAG